MTRKLLAPRSSLNDPTAVATSNQRRHVGWAAAVFMALTVSLGILAPLSDPARSIAMALGASVAVCGWSALVLPEPWRTWGICFVAGIGLLGPALGLVSIAAPNLVAVLLIVVGGVGLVYRPPRTDVAQLGVGLAAGLPFVLFIKSYQPFPLGSSFGYLNYIWNALRILEGSYYFEPERHIPGVAGFIAAQSQAAGLDGLEVLWASSAILPLVFTAGLVTMLRSFGIGWVPTIVAATATPFLIGQDQFQHLHAFIQRSMILTAIPWLIASLVANHKNEQRWSRFTASQLMPLAIGGVATLPLKWLLPGALTPYVILIGVVTLAALGSRHHFAGPMLTGLLMGAVHLFEAPLGIISAILITWLILGPFQRTLAATGIAAFTLMFGSQRLGFVDLEGSSFLAELLFGRATLPGISFARKLANLSRAIEPLQLMALGVLAALGLGRSSTRHVTLGAVGSLGFMFAVVFVPGDVQDGFTRLVGHSLPLLAILIAAGLHAVLAPTAEANSDATGRP